MPKPTPTNSHVKMPKEDFRKEHTHLVKVLLRGDREERRREAMEQAQELK